MAFYEGGQAGNHRSFLAVQSSETAEPTGYEKPSDDPARFFRLIHSFSTETSTQMHLFMIGYISSIFCLMIFHAVWARWLLFSDLNKDKVR